MNYCIVITTCGSKERAESLAKLILEARLAACIQMSEISSLYHWEGNIANDNEVKLLIKTRKELYDKLETLIAINHEYEVPEIIMIPIEKGSAAYLDWISEATKGK